MTLSVVSKSMIDGLWLHFVDARSIDSPYSSDDDIPLSKIKRDEKRDDSNMVDDENGIGEENISATARGATSAETTQDVSKYSEDDNEIKEVQSIKIKRNQDERINKDNHLEAQSRSAQVSTLQLKLVSLYYC